jgi:hypothetical protein
MTSRLVADKAEINLHIEDVTRCGGSCQGCLLTDEEKSSSAIWTQRDFAIIQSFAERFLDGVIARYGVGFNDIGVALGQGDHFLLPASAAEPIVGWLKGVAGDRAVSYLSASCVASYAKVEAVASAFHRAASEHGLPLVVNLVYSPGKARLPQFVETYGKNIRLLRDLFGAVDLNINLGPDILDDMAPAELHAFAQANGFRMVTINFAPTAYSVARFRGRWAEMVSWLIEFASQWHGSLGYEINYVPAVARAMEMQSGKTGEQVKATLIRQMVSNIYVGHDKTVAFVLDGIGHVPLNERFHLSSIGKVEDFDGRQDLLSVLEMCAKPLADRLYAHFAVRRPCLSCSFMGVCAQTGMMGVARVMRGQGIDVPDCPLDVRRLFVAVADMMASGRDLGGIAYERMNQFVQRDFGHEAFSDRLCQDGLGRDIEFGKDGK